MSEDNTIIRKKLKFTNEIADRIQNEDYKNEDFVKILLSSHGREQLLPRLSLKDVSMLWEITLRYNCSEYWGGLHNVHLVTERLLEIRNTRKGLRMDCVSSFLTRDSKNALIWPKDLLTRLIKEVGTTQFGVINETALGFSLLHLVARLGWCNARTIHLIHEVIPHVLFHQDTRQATPLHAAINDMNEISSRDVDGYVDTICTLAELYPPAANIKFRFDHDEDESLPFHAWVSFLHYYSFDAEEYEEDYVEELEEFAEGQWESYFSILNALYKANPLAAKTRILRENKKSNKFGNDYYEFVQHQFCHDMMQTGARHVEDVFLFLLEKCPEGLYLEDSNGVTPLQMFGYTNEAITSLLKAVKKSNNHMAIILNLRQTSSRLTKTNLLHSIAGRTFATKDNHDKKKTYETSTDDKKDSTWMGLNWSSNG